MPSPSPADCFCGLSRLDLLKLILQADTAIFDRLQQVIAAVNSGGGGGGGTLAGSQAITINNDTVSVVFSAPFATVPVVVANASRPVAEPIIDANIDEASITVNGFTASLGAAPASGNYKLKWMAHVVA
jgi:small ligand-binding sensory domain FIST